MQQFLAIVRIIFRPHLGYFLEFAKKKAQENQHKNRANITEAHLLIKKIIFCVVGIQMDQLYTIYKIKYINP